MLRDVVKSIVDNINDCVGVVLFRVEMGIGKLQESWFWEGRSNLGLQFHASPPYIILWFWVDCTGRWGSIGVGVI
ncbi:hypothetical protein GCM10010106_51010 [Thermopolyspora flexuosa]|nr:hypothetical protein GCM10010106_51010 [Thermopolyspora flexuosa]